MTRTLFLMRHAKAEPHHARLDFDRELAPRGWRQARETGLILADRGIELVLCSSSMRTRQTYEAMGLQLPTGDPVPVEYMEALYLASPDLIRQRIGEIPDEVTKLLVIGHSPVSPHWRPNWPGRPTRGRPTRSSAGSPPPRTASSRSTAVGRTCGIPMAVRP